MAFAPWHDDSGRGLLKHPRKEWFAMPARYQIAASGFLALSLCYTPASADPPTPAAAAAVLKRIRAADTSQLAVSEEDGRALRLLVASNRTKRALEIGSAQGYSAIWIGLGLRETGGRLVTVEYDPQRARQAEANVRAAGLADIVTVVAGDGFKVIPTLAGTFDFVLLDAWKRDYQRFFDLVYPRLDKGGLLLGHNVVNKASEMGEFLTTLRTHPGILSTIVSPSGEGVSISWKR
jgi:predicted O-methyltransferase YrrM